MTQQSALIYNFYHSRPIQNPFARAVTYQEAPSSGFILEELRKESELPDVGRNLFRGSLVTKNRLWLHFRNFARQADSNYRTGLGAPDRSACLLFYYALLNWAKAELLISRPQDIIGKKVTHGVSFDPTTAASVKGDYLTIRGNGVFPWLYEKRTGRSLSRNSRIDVKRLLLQIPEIGSQVDDNGLGEPQARAAFQLLARDDKKAWSLIATAPGLEKNRLFWRQITAHFDVVSPHHGWREHFGFSPRAPIGALTCLQLKDKVALQSSATAGTGATTAFIEAQLRTFLALEKWLEVPLDPSFDGMLCPSLYKARDVPMPSSLARYLVMFYASSLVRYRPAMFDAQLHPDQALLFDAIARECALPLLRDTITGLRGYRHDFVPSAHWRA